MFEIDENNMPIVRTHQALLALDLQNDFVAEGSALRVEHPPNLVENIVNLVSHFRPTGNVIWVRSRFEKTRAVNLTHGECERVITDLELGTKGSGSAVGKRRPSEKVLERYGRIAELNGVEEKELASPVRVEAKDSEKTTAPETFLTLEAGQKPQFVLEGSDGIRFTEPIARLIEVNSDLVFSKNHYSAFRDQKLVQILRSRFVTELYICGALSNISVFATAMDAARHGYDITIIEDCLGYRSEDRHRESLKQLEEFTGCARISSSKLIQELKKKQDKVKTNNNNNNKNINNNKTQGFIGTKKVPNVPPKSRQPKDSSLASLMTGLNIRKEGSTPSSPPKADTSQGKITSTADIVPVPESKEPEHTLSNKTKPPILTGSGLETVLGLLALEDTGSLSSDSQMITESNNELSQTRPSKPSEAEVKPRERVKTKIKTRRRSPVETNTSPSTSPSTSTSTSTPTAGPILASSATPPSVQTRINYKTQPPTMDTSKQETTIKEDSVLASKSETGEGVPPAESRPVMICEGDTTVINDLLDDEDARTIFERVRDEVRWQKMSHQGGDVPRLVAVQGEVNEDGSVPIYRHPADESPPLFPFSPFVSHIRSQVEERLGHPLNHVLIQMYRDGTDHITEHSDKTLDIAPDSFIANVSLGAQRTMVFRTKKQPRVEGASESVAMPRTSYRAPLPHNSVCKMGLVTNMRWLHGIRQDKRPTTEKSEAELEYGGERISLTFRLIGTFLDKDNKLIWGQGATSKTREEAKSVLNGKTPEAEQMIRAFGKENQSTEFDWQEHYGRGFDVLHISNSPKLFLSGDSISDLRVKMILAEYGIEWTEGKLSPTFHWKDGNTGQHAPPIPESLPVRFVDNDLSKSTVIGDKAIMHYLELVYGSTSKLEKYSRPELAKQYTRFQQTNELYRKWRAVPFSAKPFQRELQLWESFATEARFIAGSKISLADYALFAILYDVSLEWGPPVNDYPNLTAWYARVMDSEAVTKALSYKGEDAE